MNESCHIWMNLGTYEWVKTHTNETLHVIWPLSHTYSYTVCALFLSLSIPSSLFHTHTHSLHLRAFSRLLALSLCCSVLLRVAAGSISSASRNSHLSAYMYMYVAQPFHMRGDSFIRDMMHSYVLRHTHMRHSYVTWLIHTCLSWHKASAGTFAGTGVTYEIIMSHTNESHLECWHSWHSPLTVSQNVDILFFPSTNYL